MSTWQLQGVLSKHNMKVFLLFYKPKQFLYEKSIFKFKVSKSSIFDLKFINLYFCTKLSNQTNSRMFKNVFKMNLMNLKCFKHFKSAVQNTQIKHFGSKFKNLYFWTKLCSQTNSKVFVSNMNSFFEIPVHNTTIDDFKYDNSSLKLQHPNI